MYYLVNTQNVNERLGILATGTDFGKAWFMYLVHVFEDSLLIHVLFCFTAGR